jgi:hypothetical protein
MPINSQSELVNEIARRSRFLKGDVAIILGAFTELLEDLVRDKSNAFEEDKKSKLLLKSRGLGKLYNQLIPERKGKEGQTLPPVTCIIWRLSDNIRFAGREST